MLSWLGLLVIFDYRVGGVQKVQNLDYVIYGRSLRVFLFTRYPLEYHNLNEINFLKNDLFIGLPKIET